MPAVFVRGDLFGPPGLSLAHGCNCAGAMGKGIAVEFRRRFPKMYAEYRKRCADGRFNLGSVFAWTEGDVVIFNLGTQMTWRTKADLLAIETALSTMCSLAADMRVLRIGLPRIGAGFGALAWENVRHSIARIGAQTSVELVVFEEYEPRVP